ncbi:MAG TPA: DUF2232 domain-containing protein [Clostridiaceae bacterium]|nr:DUF2232 domain-containing protein [Clostridiaceae bacterium]
MENNKTQKLVKASILTSLIVVFAIMSYYVPFVELAGMIVAPIITALIYKSSGKGLTAISFFATVLLLLMMVNPISALVMPVVYYSTGIGLMLVLEYKLRPLTKIIVIASFVALGYIIMATVNIYFIMGMNLQEFLAFYIETMKTAMAEADALYEGMGLETADNAVALQVESWTVASLSMVIPTMLAIYSIAVALILHKVSEKVLKPFGIILERLPKFNEIKSNVVLVSVTLFIAMAGVALVKLEVPQGQSIMILGKSLFDIAAGIGGLSLISYYLTTKLKINKFSRILLMYLVFSTPIFFSTAIILGVIDSAFDFRNMNDDGLASIIRRKMKS